MAGEISAPATGPHVWLSNAGLMSGFLFGFTCDLDSEKGLFGARVEAFKRGTPLEANELPAQMWIASEFASDDHRKLPPILSAGGFLVVSEAVADLLRGMNLGRTRLYEVELLKSDRASKFPGRYFFLNIAEVRRYFSPDHSDRFELLEGSQTSYIATLRVVAKDDDISVTPSALTGPDIWIDDTIVSSFFFSDRLVVALRAVKVATKSLFFRCRVLAAN